jgi:hypothetical protein
LLFQILLLKKLNDKKASTRGNIQDICWVINLIAFIYRPRELVRDPARTGACREIERPLEGIA